MKRLLLLVLAVSLLGLVPATTASAAPSNDDFANATSITTVPTDLPTESNVGASVEPGEPLSGGFFSTVWYKFTPRRTRDYTVSLCGSSSNLAVTVFRGSQVSSLRQVTQPALDNCGSSFPSPGTTSWIGRRGVTYYIQVAGFNGGSGSGEGTFPFQLTNGPGGLYVSNGATREGNRGRHPMIFTVTLGRPVGHAVAFRWFTSDCFVLNFCVIGPGEAQSGLDYVGNNGIAFIPKGHRRARFAVQVVGDREVEVNEVFNVFLTNPHGTSIVQGFGTGTIVNDDRT